jgi:hypothetical protein
VAKLKAISLCRDGPRGACSPGARLCKAVYTSVVVVEDSSAILVVVHYTPHAVVDGLFRYRVSWVPTKWFEACMSVHVSERCEAV